jgi:hypothetical protein
VEMPEYPAARTAAGNSNVGSSRDGRRRARLSEERLLWCIPVGDGVVRLSDDRERK